MYSNLPERDDDRAVLLRLGLDAGASAVDTEVRIADLFDLGATGIEQRDGPDGAVLLAGFPNRLAAEAALAQLCDREQLHAIVDVPDDTWFDGWRAYAKAQRAGKRLLVVPPWIALDEAPGPDDIVLSIDPGRSFGSGAHPTTRLVLAELETHIVAGASMLDVGCGSGVLTVAAARLGAGRLVAIDIDPAAVVATTENLARHDVTAEVGAQLDRVDAHRFDVVAANIGANALIELAAALAGRGAVLLLSGFFADRADEVASAYARYEATPLYVREAPDDGWVVLALAGAPLAAG